MAETDAQAGQDAQEAEEGQQQAEEAPEVKALKEELAKEKATRLKVEQALTRQGYELGEQRKLIDRALLSKVEAPKEKPDFFTDPDAAVKNAITSHPAIQGLAQSAETLKRQTMTAALKAQHPDYMEISKDEGFAKWIEADPKRTELYLQADQGYDLASANFLLNTWKERQSIAKTTKAEEEVKAKNADALRTAKVDTGTSASGGKKVYSRTDLMRLRTSDPDKYNSMNVAQLYAEGRVK